MNWMRAVAMLAVILLATAARAAEPAPLDETSRDASRGAFARFLDSHPEIADTVLFNPQFVRDPGYLNDHPELGAFLEAHPLVKADPRAFLSSQPHRYPEPDVFEKISPLLGFGSVMLALLWVLRSLLANRRWNKAAATQAEIHTKLLDRFGSSQEMLAYMQTDAGKRFLESGTIAPEGGPAPKMPYLIGRILWSIQTGLILLFVGIGLLWVKDGVAAESAKALMVLGTLALTLGGGFILSAAVSYLLSKRLGLLPAAPAPSPNRPD